MYKSPIEIFYGEMETYLEGEILKATQKVGVYVDKKELLQALKFDREQYDKGYEDGLNADKWIPCSERLPEESGNYIVCGKYVTWVANWFCDTWWDIEKKCRWTNVIAWQPLPKPYKPKGE